MKRYDILDDPGGCCPIPPLLECSGGDWVKFETAARMEIALREIRARMSLTDIYPDDVKRLHGEIFAIAHAAIYSPE